MLTSLTPRFFFFLFSTSFTSPSLIPVVAFDSDCTSSFTNFLIVAVLGVESAPPVSPVMGILDEEANVTV